MNFLSIKIYHNGLKGEKNLNKAEWSLRILMKRRFCRKKWTGKRRQGEKSINLMRRWVKINKK